MLVDVLLDAQEHSLTGISRDDLLASVREKITAATEPETAERLTAPDHFDIDARMKSLNAWGVVHRWQDAAKTEADFVRTRDRYQLTSEAADLHRWLRRKIDEDAVATSAAAFAPAIIADRLDETLLALAERDHVRAARAWAQVRTTLKDMAEAATIWQSRMASALAGAPDQEKMRRLRETLMAYVTVWGAGVDTYSPRIRNACAKLGGLADEEWRAIVLVGVDADAAEETVQAILHGHKEAAQTLDSWFRSGRGQALRLRRQVRDAVTPLLRGSRTLLATGGRVTRRAESKRIAAAIESAASDEEVWRVWCAATGLWGARHLAGYPDERTGRPCSNVVLGGTSSPNRCDPAEARHPLGEEPSRTCAEPPSRPPCRTTGCRAAASRDGPCRAGNRGPVWCLAVRLDRDRQQRGGLHPLGDCHRRHEDAA